MIIIETVGISIYLIGMIASVTIVIISGWELHQGNKKVPHEKFVKTTWLVGITTVISGFGGLLMIVGSSLSSELSIIRILLSTLGCIGIYPAILTATYIFSMKSRGYIETNDQGGSEN